jgi:hypothetical protein
MPDLKTLQQDLADTRQEVRNLQVIAMRPDLPAEKLELVRNMERSARAEVKLRLKAIEYAKTSLAGTYLMTKEQHLARAQELRKHNPDSRAAVLHEVAAKMRELKAQK